MTRNSGATTLQAGGIAVDVNPWGAEVSSIRSVGGTEILFQTPWNTRPSDRGADDNSWVRGWHGGWTVLFPNAGPACTVNSVAHQYHGEVATQCWDVDAVSERSISLSTTVTGPIHLQRKVTVDRFRVTVDTQISNGSNQLQPFVLVEHLILGPGVVGKRSNVELPQGRRLTLDPSSDVDRWEGAPARGRSRFGSIEHSAPFRAHVASGDGSIGVEIRWCGQDLEHMWYWWENGGERQEPWSSRTKCLGLEPSSSPLSTGLEEAITTGQARWLAAGETRQTAVALTVKEPAAT